MARDVGGDADLTWAYNDLDIKNRNITDETILYYYKTKTGVDTDNLKSQKDHAKALQIIADDRESDFLWAKIADPEAVVLTPNEPVGLDNIGNTCYLNSLLQFYYTIKAVRELVLNIDKYRMDLNSSNAEDDIRNKQVGGRKIKTFEVIKAQKCMFTSQSH
jgi:ubiquitin carboxyl-terminal hydrolase 25/28